MERLGEGIDGWSSKMKLCGEMGGCNILRVLSRTTINRHFTINNIYNE